MSILTMDTTSTLCAHCEQETVVNLPDEDTEIVGKTKKPYSPADDWGTFTCRNCDHSFGVYFG